MKVDRRLVLAGGGALLALGGAGLAASLHDTRRVIGWVLRHYLGDVRVTNEALDAFVKAFGPTFEARYSLKQTVAWLTTVAAPVDIPQVEYMERDLLTNFLLGSDFFQPDRPKDAPITFVALPQVACGNPFMRT
jgi:hypothetical protein